MKTLMLDLDPTSPNYGDILIDNHNMKLGCGEDYIRQKLRTSLKLVYGEWFLDTTVGLKYFETVFVRSPNLSTIESMFKAAITDSYGVSEITDFNMDFVKGSRELIINFTVKTIYDTSLTISERLP